MIRAGLEFVQSPQYTKVEFLRKQVIDLQLERSKNADLLKQRKCDYTNQLQEWKERERSLVDAKERENLLLVGKIEELKQTHLQELYEKAAQNQQTQQVLLDSRKIAFEEEVSSLKEQLEGAKLNRSAQLQELESRHREPETRTVEAKRQELNHQLELT